jgi:hypothetical protein
VARWDPTASRARGGEGIQTHHPSRTRLTTGLGALVALLIAGIDAVAHGGNLKAPIAVIAGCATLLLLFGLIRRRPLTIPWSVLLTAAAYMIGREGSPVVDGGAAIVGALLLLSAELASWSIDHDARIQSEQRLVAWRAGVIGVLVLSALLLNFLLLGAAAVSASTGLVVAAAGVVAAVSAVAIVLRLVRA